MDSVTVLFNSVITSLNLAASTSTTYLMNSYFDGLYPCDTGKEQQWQAVSPSNGFTLKKLQILSEMPYV